MHLYFISINFKRFKDFKDLNWESVQEKKRVFHSLLQIKRYKHARNKNLSIFLKDKLEMKR